MNATRTLGIALASAAASLAATPAALAWPGCSHPRITAATASDLDAVHRTNRDALIPGRGFATGWQETQDQRNGTDSQGTDRGDRRFRIIEGLQMPAQPRWRM